MFLMFLLDDQCGSDVSVGWWRGCFCWMASVVLMFLSGGQYGCFCWMSGVDVSVEWPVWL